MHNEGKENGIPEIDKIKYNSICNKIFGRI